MGRLTQKAAVMGPERQRVVQTDPVIQKVVLRGLESLMASQRDPARATVP